MKQFVIPMGEAGLKATTCNNRIRVANAYSIGLGCHFTFRS